MCKILHIVTTSVRG